MIRGAVDRTPLFRFASREPRMELPSMSSKPIVGNLARVPQALNVPRAMAPVSPPLPLDSKPLNWLAAGIVADATHRPRELLDRFDTQQQGE